MFSSLASILLLAFGFGFVIFFHELGHFLAAKWADVKVEQFAVGFGQAMFSWRKGMGFRWGSSQEEFQKRLTSYVEEHHNSELQFKERTEGPTDEQLSQAAKALNISETEYRLNWIPLGGYVKMLGQDDLKPGVTANDPRAYNNKTISQRMVIVSAGVIMNVILAAIGFMIAFLLGLPAAPAIVGNLQPGSPAQSAYRLVNGQPQLAPLQPGDTILTLDGRAQADFTKIGMNVALSEEGRALPIDVKRVSGQVEQLFIQPGKPKDEAKNFLMLGITQPYELRGLDPEEVKTISEETKDLELDDPLAVAPGDRITQIQGKAVTDARDFPALDAAMQNSKGQPIELTVVNAKGATRTVKIRPAFEEPFSKDPLNFAGMLPRTMLDAIVKGSPAEKKLLPGDVIIGIASAKDGGDQITNPSRPDVMKWFSDAGSHGEAVNIKVFREGKEVTISNIVPSYTVERGHKGMGVQLDAEANDAIVGGLVTDSPAALANVPPGAKIVSVDGNRTTTWGDVDAALKQVTGSKPFTVIALVGGQERPFTFGPLSSTQLAELHQNRYGPRLMLHEYIEIRKTSNPITAAQWGIGETRDALVQVYLTVRRMVQGSVSYKNVSGPVGIFVAGYGFANKGTTWLLWFLSIISANLAVMNFLPIPIVDGGLFTFLIIEKIKGGPVSPKVQSIAQIVGLAILLSVFVLATYQDVFYRLPFLNH